MPDITKTIYLLDIDDYAPEIIALTRPLVFEWADKIEANIHYIQDRKYPHMPIVYEKFQIRELASEFDDDWNIYIDSDALIHPECIDFTELINKDTVMHHGCDLGSVRWRYNNYFRRDGRNIGSCNWFTIASDWCLDLWAPLEQDLDVVIGDIFPTPAEINSGVIEAEHLIDDYVMSCNIARYGLKFKSVVDLMAEIGQAGANFFHHRYTIDATDKVKDLKAVLEKWNLPERIYS